MPRRKERTRQKPKNLQAAAKRHQRKWQQMEFFVRRAKQQGRWV